MNSLAVYQNLIKPYNIYVIPVFKEIAFYDRRLGDEALSYSANKLWIHHVPLHLIRPLCNTLEEA